MMMDEYSAIYASDAAVNSAPTRVTSNHRDVSVDLGCPERLTAPKFENLWTRSQRQVGIFVLVLITHILVVGIMTFAPLTFKRPLRELPLTMLSLTQSSKVVQIKTQIAVESMAIAPIKLDLPRLKLIAENLVADSAEQPHGRITPPHPTGPGVDASPFAVRGGLVKGSGATVVLRVEVLGSGKVGRVEIDVSGGSQQVDRAATAYVRALTWVAGLFDDKPETLWVRWGVRLDG